MNKKIQIMGILNITPDSFSDGGNYFGSLSAAVKRAKEMIAEGANIIDIGGESTRPGSCKISTDEEIKRVLPVLLQIRKELGNTIPLSIDTYKSVVAKKALENGATIINSLGGASFDRKILDVVKEYDCPFIIYHIKGIPSTMQKRAIKYHNVIKEIKDFFEEQIRLGVSSGIKREQYIIDPGIGFGKTTENNIEIIKNLDKFTSLCLPLSIGVSRKGHIGTILQKELHLDNSPGPLERLEGSLAETAIAIQNGAQIIRTHDVKETKKFIAILEKFL